MELSSDFSANILRNLITELHFINGKIIEEVIRSEDISINQFYILEYLNRNKKTSTTELANVLKISQPAVTQFINKLVQLEYISKNNHPEDKRRTIFALTQGGQKKIKILQDHQVSIIKNRIGAMDKGKDLFLIEGLKSFVDSWNRRNTYES
ncbi:MarR family transcriptional regulator [Irregularibacter muris]|uniref:MarR family transcriptional regulator n=1 Tax=Irregularibacter muris TaxID=1796619 RepID=A0AAE3HEF6_9FIRM|nr:MarR family transcriptional regulator [Irregularibacter muris]MCR1897598.1 MarR family transcriptional regulator [Irregularibacter muris]